MVGILAYLVLVLALRATGKRALTKLNAFDLVVTVALGSTLASVLLSESVALVEGVTAFVLLLTMQYVVSWLATRSTHVERLVSSEPSLVYSDGFLLPVMRRQRVTHDDLRQAARKKGYARPGRRPGDRPGERREPERAVLVPAPAAGAGRRR